MRKYLGPLAVLAALGIGGVVGWLAKDASLKIAAESSVPDVLRAGGYDLINPLLLCQSTDKDTTKDEHAEEKLRDVVNKHIKDGTFTTASVYLRGIPNGQWAEINGDQRYYPASMEKVPVMMAYFSLAESDPSTLSRKMLYDGAKDANAQQEVTVRDPLVAGRDYTVMELIEHMIIRSDNNATKLLFNNLDQSVFRGAFSELRVPFLGPGEAPADFMTARDYSLFLRVLYNATYLNRTFSEKALDILSRSDFNSGITAGVPAGTKVAHKFGLVSVMPDGKNVSMREMHDCGLVYASPAPYVICIMTKSTAPIAAIEAGIADISRTAYAVRPGARAAP